MEESLPGDTAGVSLRPFAGEALYRRNLAPFWDSAGIHFESPPIVGCNRAALASRRPASLADSIAAASQLTKFTLGSTDGRAEVKRMLELLKRHEVKTRISGDERTV